METKRKRGRQINVEMDKLVYEYRIKKKLSFRQIATLLGIDVKSVYRRYQRVKPKKKKKEKALK